MRGFVDSRANENDDDKVLDGSGGEFRSDYPFVGGSARPCWLEPGSKFGCKIWAAGGTT